MAAAQSPPAIKNDRILWQHGPARPGPGQKLPRTVAQTWQGSGPNQNFPRSVTITERGSP